MQPTLRRIHLQLDTSGPTGHLQAATGASVSALARAGLVALNDLLDKNPRKARRLVALHESEKARSFFSSPRA